MSTPIHGYERYERAKGYFAEAEYLEAARELEDFFTDLAAARAGQEGTTYADDPVGHEAPDDPYAHLLLGRTLQRAGRPDEARGPLRLAELLGGYETSSGAAEVSDSGA